MKNYLLSAVSLSLLAMGASAQQLAPTQGGSSPDVKVTAPAKYKQGPLMRENIISDWYNYGDAIYTAGGDVSYFRNFLFPDSTVQVEFSDGMGYVWKHSMGEVFDPASTLFVSNGQTNVETGIPYTFDSLAIPYRYWRFQHANPDTLVVQVYMEPNIDLEPNPGWTSGASYATVDYDYTKRIGDNETLTFKRLLTHADTTADGDQRFLEFAINLNIPADKKVAATATYFPGNPINVNDTVDTYATFEITNKRNAFVFYDYRDNDLLVEPGYYNNEISVPTDVRYNINTNGWNGSYIAGTAWESGIYYGDMYFKITFDADFVGVNEMDAENQLNVFPNPTTGILHINSQSSVVRAEVKDMSGKTVMTSNGNNITQLDASVIGKGVYMLTLQNINGKTINKRFVKQ